ncbi:response regulator transcription factor [Alsobacter sp. KACC 23698]|uniref:Response regulator transcription factor n=1 Tax=Alsobacter sp. KACC 23698 TaxID=3149229 RepID=A0AAU7JJE0_9HYPH
MGNSSPAIVVERNALLRDGLVGLLKSTHIKVIASGSTLDECRSFAVKVKPKLVVGSLDGADDLAAWIGSVRADYPEAKIAVLSDCADAERISLALRLGVGAFVLNSMSSAAFIGALELCLMGVTILPCGSFLAQDLAQMLSFPAPPKPIQVIANIADGRPRLSSREVSILRLLIEGWSNKLIARELAIAEATVKVHVKAVLRKIRVQNRTQAAIWAMSNGVLSSDADLTVDMVPAITVQSAIPVHA